MESQPFARSSGKIGQSNCHDDIISFHHPVIISDKSSNDEKQWRDQGMARDRLLAKRVNLCTRSTISPGPDIISETYEMFKKELGKFQGIERPRSFGKDEEAIIRRDFGLYSFDDGIDDENDEVEHISPVNMTPLKPVDHIITDDLACFSNNDGSDKEGRYHDIIPLKGKCISPSENEALDAVQIATSLNTFHSVSEGKPIGMVKNLAAELSSSKVEYICDEIDDLPDLVDVDIDKSDDVVKLALHTNGKTTIHTWDRHNIRDSDGKTYHNYVEPISVDIDY